MSSSITEEKYQILFYDDYCYFHRDKGVQEPKVQTARAYPCFISMKHLGVLLLPLDGMLVHRRVTPQQYVTRTHLYTWVKRDKVE